MIFMIFIILVWNSMFVMIFMIFELNSKNDNLAVWIFKNNLICCFEKITVGFDFISFPQLKINDFENLTPFQRLTITLKIRGNEKFMEKYILKEKRNIIDILLQYVEILTKILDLSLRNCHSNNKNLNL